MKKPIMQWLLPAVIGFSSLTACKKDKDEPISTPTPTPPVTASAADKVKDTTLLYARDAYLWYTQIPASFDARSHADPNAIMTAIRQYSSEPGFTSAVDKWSFAIDQNSWNNASSGVSGDFGLIVFFMSGSQDLRVAAVEKQSSAGRAGVQRGWRITKVNGNDVSGASGTTLQNAIYGSNSTAFTFQKPDNSLVNITLNATSYQENPIYLDSVYQTNNGKLGYIVFNSFLGDTTAIYNEFNRVFNKFSSAGVTHVAVDLRYNGGGYVSMQDKLANYLVNSSANGQLMMKQEFNDKLKNYNSTTYFKKLGSLNPNKIFFIVGKNTASASELLINNLQPHMNVSVIGSSKTYGKPVGYFPIPVGTWYTFPVSFRSTNKNGQGNYFGGINIAAQEVDGLTKNWGDSNEELFALVLRHMNTGSFGRIGGTANNVNAIEKQRTDQLNEKLSDDFFRGMIDTRGIKK
jgi:C-terminal processing protease CtpA/Prc